MTRSVARGAWIIPGASVSDPFARSGRGRHADGTAEILRVGIVERPVHETRSITSTPFSLSDDREGSCFGNRSVWGERPKAEGNNQ